MYGYHGKALIVDLTMRQTRWEILDQAVLQAFIGGTGLGAYLLYLHSPTGTEALSPENPLIFAASPLVGSRLTTSSKFAVVTKSPLTGFIGDSLSSSFLATELKRTGCDALVIIGKSKTLTLLSIEDGEVRYIEAADLAGLSTSETESRVKESLGARTRVACIGPAGERLVRFASISNDGGRQAARTGPGAVMGSKNLKAIAFRGTSVVPVHDPAAVAEVGRDLAIRSVGPATEKYRTLGTMANVSVFNRLGILPTRNFQQSTFDEADSVSGEAFHKTHFTKNAHCANCTIGCEHVMTTIDKGPLVTGRVEYESGFALGSLVGVSDPNAVIRASTLCDEFGMDTISAGATIAWAMECYEKGVFTDADTGGIDMKFGNAEGVMTFLRLIGERDGLGDLLADGTRIASQKVGQDSGTWAMHVKGLEMPGYEPRSLHTLALALAVSTRGACHNRSSAYETDLSNRVDRLQAGRERGKITMDGEDFSAVLDSLIWCKFLRKAFYDFYGESAEIYENITGWHTSAEQLQQAGERINNMKKLFNLREGWTRNDDTLPQRVLQEVLPDGMAAGTVISSKDLDMMVSAYYEARGWTVEGNIPESKLAELGLDILVTDTDSTEVKIV